MDIFGGYYSAYHTDVLSTVFTNNLRYANDTTLMAESEEELKNLLMKLKEESEKAGASSVRSRKLQSYVP